MSSETIKVTLSICDAITKLIEPQQFMDEVKRNFVRADSFHKF